MITKIKKMANGNSLITVSEYGLPPGTYPSNILGLKELAREQKKLFAIRLEWDDNTPSETKEAHYVLDNQLAKLIDSKCKENQA